MAKIKCFNYNAKWHFAHDCPKPKKVFNYTQVSEICITSFVFLIDSYSLWIIGSRAIGHVAKDIDPPWTFSEYCLKQSGSM